MAATAAALLLCSGGLPRTTEAFVQRAGRAVGAWGLHQQHHQQQLARPLRLAQPVRMSSSTTGSTGTGTGTGASRSSTSTSRATSSGGSTLPPLPLPLPSLQQLLTGGRQLLEESLQVAREVGPRAGLARTLSATKAVAETSRDVLRELAEYQRAVQAGGGNAAEVSPFTTQRLARTLRVFFERMGATYLKLGQFIASSPTLFPPELVLEMQKCLDQTEPVPYGAFSRVCVFACRCR